MPASNTSNDSYLFGLNDTGDSMKTPSGSMASNETSFTMTQELRITLFSLIIALSAFGVSSSIINIIIFWKLRKDDPINVTFFGLSLSDFMVCVTSLVFFLATGQWYLEEIYIHLKITPMEVMFLTVGVSHYVSANITILLTTFIAFQRCVCIVLPLKVRALFTHTRVTISVVLSFILPSLMMLTPAYCVNRLQWGPIPEHNISVLQNVMTDDFHDVKAWSTPTNTVALLVIPFVIVSVCSVIMIKHLRQTMNWRLRATKNDFAWATRTSKEFSLSSTQSSSRSTKRDSIVRKERRILKLVLVITLVFFFSYVPNRIIANFINLTGRFDGDFDQFIVFVSMILDTTNSSVSIFIYHRYSTKYKMTFQSLICHKNG